jgi:hypothetical protein
MVLWIISKNFTFTFTVKLKRLSSKAKRDDVVKKSNLLRMVDSLQVCEPGNNFLSAHTDTAARNHSTTLILRGWLGAQIIFYTHLHAVFLLVFILFFSIYVSFVFCLCADYGGVE